MKEETSPKFRLTEDKYWDTCRSARRNPMSPNPVTKNAGKSLEEDYLYTVLLLITVAVGREAFKLGHKISGESDSFWLRRAIHDLVAKHQTNMFDIQPTLFRCLFEGSRVAEHNCGRFNASLFSIATQGGDWVLCVYETPEFPIKFCPFCGITLENTSKPPADEEWPEIVGQ